MDQNLSTQDIVHIDSMLKDLIPLFMQNRRNEISQLEEMYAAKDYESLACYGHHLKGVSLNYVYQKLGALGIALEAAAKEKNYLLSGN